MPYASRKNKLRRPSTSVAVRDDVYPGGSLSRLPLLKGCPRGRISPPVHQQAGSKRSGGQRRSAQVNTKAPVLRETASTGASPYYLYERSAS